MIEYDELEQRMVLKLVYYAPALSGKTTNLLLPDFSEEEIAKIFAECEMEYKRDNPKENIPISPQLW